MNLSYSGKNEILVTLSCVWKVSDKQYSRHFLKETKIL